MEIRELEIKGLFLITSFPHLDSRGFFMRTYDEEAFKSYGLHREWVQENHSRSEKKGIIRGLHFQQESFAETKLVRCIRGEIFDVAVDLRKGSPTFGKWHGVNLSEENMKMFYIPRGFAHGFCTLSGESEVLYKVDNIYSPQHEVCIAWNDPHLAIPWPLEGEPIISDKDREGISTESYKRQFLV